MKWLTDILRPKADAVQIILKRKGAPAFGVYKDGEVETRSPPLKKERSDDPSSANR